MSGVLARLARDLRTARHIPAAQLLSRLRFLRQRRRYARAPHLPLERAARDAANLRARDALPRPDDRVLAPEGLDAVAERAERFAAGRFRYLGVEADYASGIRWRDPDRSPLWQYQLQYLGAVLDLALTGDLPAARAIVTSWRGAHADRWDPVAWHPYPASLRLANLCHAAGVAGSFEALGTGVDALCARHVTYLREHLEHDVRGNHLLENARALCVAARFLRGGAELDWELGPRLLRTELSEQVLADGGHFERSAMYHLLVLQRVLEELACAPSPARSAPLAAIVRRMCSWLRHVLCPDGAIPLLGDSARGFAPPAETLLALARELLPDLDLEPAVERVTLLRESGVCVLRGPSSWALVDVGPVCPSYLPAHGQADTLSVEVWLRGVCVVTDPGLCEYTGPEREWGRSSRAHSTLTVDDRDNSEVYGSFRVGGRERLGQVSADGAGVAAQIRPWGRAAHLSRRVSLLPGPAGGFLIEDDAEIPAGSVVRARLHLAPEVRIEATLDDGRGVRLATAAGPVLVRAAQRLDVEPGRCSREFGKTEPTSILVQRLGGDGATVAGRIEILPDRGDA